MHTANTERIITQILRQPERFEMIQWITPKYDLVTHHVDVCQTACCVAGWAVINDLTDNLGSHDQAIVIGASRVEDVAHGRMLETDWQSEGRRLLELDTDEEGMVPLFFRHEWPVHYRELEDLTEWHVHQAEDAEIIPPGAIPSGWQFGEAVAGATLLRDMLDGTVRLEPDEWFDHEDESDSWWSQFAHNHQEA